MTNVRSVNLAGDFNNWSATNQPLSDDDGDGTWTLDLELIQGIYRYKFVLEGSTWVHDPNNPEKEDDQHEGFNSILRLGDMAFRSTPAVSGDGDIFEKALLHNPQLAKYLDPTDPRGKIVRFRSWKNDLSEVFIRYPVESNVVIAMQKTLQTSKFDYYETILEMGKLEKIEYDFLIKDGTREINYSKTGIKERLVQGELFETNTNTSTLKVPDWVKDSIFYQIFPERFYNGNPNNDPPETVDWNAEPTWFNFMGGDIKGIETKLDYLTDLGVTALYLNPIFDSISNHKYDARNFMIVDPNFGDKNSLIQLTDALHKNDMKIILDVSLNHCGDEFWAFQDVIKNETESLYLDWFNVYSFPIHVKKDPNYEAWWGFGDMPEFNINNPVCRDHLMQVAEYWPRETGVDGWRLDVASELPHDFWKEFRTRTKTVDPNSYLLAEIWGDGTPWLQGDQFDSVMNYRFREAVLQGIGNRSISLEEMMNRLLEQQLDYSHEANLAMFNLLGSHDTARFLTLAGGDLVKLKQAWLLQMTYIGAPSIYYGDEVGMEGGKDPDNRRGMIWDKNLVNAELQDLMKDLIKIRKDEVALRRGNFETLEANNEKGIFSFKRKYQNDEIVVVLNFGGNSKELKIGNSESQNLIYYDLLTPQQFESQEGKIKVTSENDWWGMILMKI